MAALLEYFYLVSFVWMAVEGVLLYYMLRKVFKDQKLFKRKLFQTSCWRKYKILIKDTCHLFAKYDFYIKSGCFFSNIKYLSSFFCAYSLIPSFISEDLIKHGVPLSYVLVNNFCNFVTTINRGTLNWSEQRKHKYKNRCKYVALG